MKSYADVRVDEAGSVLNPTPTNFPSGKLQVDGVDVTTGGGGGSPEIDFTAAQDIPAFTVVTSTGQIADSGNPVSFYGRVIGITDTAVTSGHVGTAIATGEITNGAWSWTPGAKLFLNGTSISATPPSSGFSQLVALALSANTIVVELNVPVLL